VTGRTVLFGATGYTGRLTAEAMVARGERPVIAGRSPERLAELAVGLGGLESRVADVTRPETVRGLVEPGDVVVTTVGPFARWATPLSRLQSTLVPPTSTPTANRPSSDGSSNAMDSEQPTPAPGS
jgi:short subunit dehydrogenase-like uncharacterized protein